MSDELVFMGEPPRIKDKWGTPIEMDERGKVSAFLHYLPGHEGSYKKQSHNTRPLPAVTDDEWGRTQILKMVERLAEVMSTKGWDLVSSCTYPSQGMLHTYCVFRDDENAEKAEVDNDE